MTTQDYRAVSAPRDLSPDLAGWADCRAKLLKANPGHGPKARLPGIIQDQASTITESRISDRDLKLLLMVKVHRALRIYMHVW